MDLYCFNALRQEIIQLIIVIRTNPAIRIIDVRRIIAHQLLHCHSANLGNPILIIQVNFCVINIYATRVNDKILTFLVCVYPVFVRIQTLHVYSFPKILLSYFDKRHRLSPFIFYSLFPVWEILFVQVIYMIELARFHVRPHAVRTDVVTVVVGIKPEDRYTVDAEETQVRNACILFVLLIPDFLFPDILLFK